MKFEVIRGLRVLDAFKGCSKAYQDVSWVFLDISGSSRDNPGVF